MISLFCCLHEKYEKYKLSRLLKKLDKPMSIDLTSLRSKFSTPKQIKAVINLSIIYDSETRQLQVSQLEIVNQ